METRKFWVEDGSGSHFDFDAFYASLTDAPMTEHEKQMLKECWNMWSDEFQPYIEQCTTKEGYEALSAREKFQYHKEEYSAGLG